MTRLLLYMFPGLVLNALILLANTFLLDPATFYESTYGAICPIIQMVAIIIPCVIYYIKMPPGQDTRP